MYIVVSVSQYVLVVNGKVVNKCHLSLQCELLLIAGRLNSKMKSDLLE